MSIQSRPSKALIKRSLTNIDALKSLSCALTADHINAGALDVFFHHLDPAKVPPYDQTTTTTTTTLIPVARFAFLSLLGLQYAMIYITNPGPRRQTFTLRRFPGVIQWLMYINSLTIAEDSSNLIQVHSELIHVFYMTSKDIVDMDGTIEFIVRLWLGSRTEEDRRRTAPLLPNIVGLEGNHSRLNRVVAAVPDADVMAKPTLIAKTAIIRLVGSINNPGHKYDDLEWHTQALYALAVSPSHPLKGAILDGGGVRAVTMSLVHLSSLLAAQPKKSIRNLIYSSFRLLCDLIGSAEGAKWIIQTIHAGFFTAFTTWISSVPTRDTGGPDGPQSVILDLLALLHGHLNHRSVIRSIYPAFLQVNTKEVKASLKRSAFSVEWRKLETELTLNFLIEQSYTNTGGQDQDGICGNGKVRSCVLFAF